MARYVGRAAELPGPPEGSCYVLERDRYGDAIRTARDKPDLTREDAARFRFADLG